jgi:hypothetical protein
MQNRPETFSGGHPSNVALALTLVADVYDAGMRCTIATTRVKQPPARLAARPRAGRQ